MLVLYVVNDLRKTINNSEKRKKSQGFKKNVENAFRNKFYALKNSRTLSHEPWIPV